MPPIDREHGLDDFDEIARLEREWAAMKAMKAGKKEAMTGNDIIKTIAGATELKPKVVKSIFTELQTIAYKEVAKTEKFVIPQLVMLKLRHKPATKAGKRMIFGKEQVVKAKPAKKVLKAFAAKALQDAVVKAFAAKALTFFWNSKTNEARWRMPQNWEERFCEVHKIPFCFCLWPRPQN